MATAPKPGAARAQAASLQAFRLRVRDRTVDVPLPGNLPIKEKFAVKAATGLAIEAHFKSEGAFGEDTLIVLFWLGRRGAGEPNLAFDRAVAEWPDDLTEDDLDFSLIDLNADEDLEVEHPEA